MENYNFYFVRGFTGNNNISGSSSSKNNSGFIYNLYNKIYKQLDVKYIHNYIRRQ